MLIHLLVSIIKEDYQALMQNQQWSNPESATSFLLQAILKNAASILSWLSFSTPHFLHSRKFQQTTPPINTRISRDTSGEDDQTAQLVS